MRLTVFYPLTELFALVLVMMFLHELSHFMVAKLFGLRIMDYRFNSISLEWKKLSRWKKILITSSGAGSTIFLSMVFFELGFEDWFIVGMILGIGNFIPFCGTDGAVITRMLRRQR